MPGKEIKNESSPREASGIDNMNLDAAIVMAVISYEVGINDYNTLHNEARENSQLYREF